MPLKDRVFFTRYFAILLHAGLTISQSLEILEDQLKSPAWKKILPTVKKTVESGHTLSDALAQFPDAFPPFYTKMIGVGEKSGNLADVFKHLKVQLEKDWSLVSKVKRAFVYPVVIFCILLAVSVGLLVFIVPRVAKLFIQLKIDLPLPTRMLLAAQYGVQHYGIFILAGLIIAAVGCKFLLRIENVRYYYHKFSLHIPLMGKIIRYLNLARFSQILNTLLSGGVPLVNAIAIASATVDNLIFRKVIAAVTKSVTGGQSLADSLAANPKIFPSLMAHMIAIGERTGNLQEQANELSRLYASEVNNSVKTLSTLIEPLLLVIVAAGVGSIALSIVLPLYQLPNLLHK